MKWPHIEPGETFEDVENREGISKETNDCRLHQLGYHPCRCFYRGIESVFSFRRLLKARRQFDRIAVKYS